MKVYLVWFQFNDPPTRGVLAAYGDEEDARRHVERATRQESDEDGWPRFSAAEILGVAHVWVEPLEVKVRAQVPEPGADKTG